MDNDRFSSTNLPSYVKYLTLQKVNVLARTPEEYLKDYDLSVITVWEASYEIISRKNPFSASIITLSGLLDRSRLSFNPRFVLLVYAISKYPEHFKPECENRNGKWSLDPSIVYKCLDETILSRFLTPETEIRLTIQEEIVQPSLALHVLQPNPEEARIAGAPMFMMHRLAHEWSFARLTAEQKRIWTKAVLVILAISFYLAKRDLCQVLNHHLSHLVTLLPWLRADEGTHKACQILMEFAIEQFNYITAMKLAPYVSLPGHETPGDRLHSMMLQSRCLSKAGNYDEAMDLAEKCVSGWESFKPTQPLELARAQRLLGRQLVLSSAEKNAQKAIRLLQVSIETFREMGDDNLDAYLQARTCLAVAYSKIGEHTEAIRMLEEVIREGAALPRSAYFDISMVENDLGNALYLQVRDDRSKPGFDPIKGLSTLCKAKSLLEEVLDKQTKVLGTNHDDTELTYQNIITVD